jgi:hypothetical protein
MGYASDWGHDDGGPGDDNGYDDREYHDPLGRYHKDNPYGLEQPTQMTAGLRFPKRGRIRTLTEIDAKAAEQRRRITELRARLSNDPSVWVSRNGKIKLSDMSNNHLTSAMAISTKINGLTHKRTIALHAEINKRLFVAIQLTANPDEYF